MNSLNTKPLGSLIAGVAPSAAATPISGITADSRAVRPGMLFVAVRGTAVDGHRFIPSAISAGAAAIVCEEAPTEHSAGVAIITVADSARALGHIASAWYGNPSSRLRLVGVTGTNGKTTIATLLYDLARMTGIKAGLLSTVVNRIDTEAVEATHTTPDPIELNSLLARMVEAGCTFAAMEVSSHAAAQQRIAGLTFAGGVFTNLTRDHLDYHGTFKAYLQAKQSFFDALPPEAFALTNIDDPNGLIMIQNTRARRYTYSLRSEADFRGSVIEDMISGMLMAFNGSEVHTRFCGRFNAANLTAVFGAASLLSLDGDKLLVDMSRLTPVSGRFQTLTSPRGVTAVVDYAHTPDALVNVLDTIREIIGRRGRIITVCGAGGDRDRGKRPIMAAEAAHRSDALILTSDNPRTEGPDQILREMLAGLEGLELSCAVAVEPDRRLAIRRAVAEARQGDVVLVAGKGHEDYQIIGTVKHHFDDREEVAAAFAINS